MNQKPLLQLKEAVLVRNGVRSMTPDWMFQILLAVIGILGSGAVWHFISSKQYHVAIWVGFSGFVLLFLVIALYLRNELLKAEEFSPTTAARVKSYNNLDVPIRPNLTKGRKLK